jgi:hypothetical protein
MSPGSIRPPMDCDALLRLSLWQLDPIRTVRGRRQRASERWRARRSPPRAPQGSPQPLAQVAHAAAANRSFGP